MTTVGNTILSSETNIERGPVAMVDNVFNHHTEFFSVTVETHNPSVDHSEDDSARPTQLPNVVVTPKENMILEAMASNDTDRIERFIRSTAQMLTRIQMIRNGEFSLFEWD